jgi:hypothetical protein
MSGVEDILVSFHESGHCLAYAKLGCGDQIQYVTLQPRPLVQMAQGQRVIWTEAIACIGGLVAEWIFRGTQSTISEILAGPGRDDLSMAEAALRRYAERPEESVAIIAKYGRLPEIQDAVKLAERLVFRHWHDVRWIATELLQHGRLTGPYVATLIEQPKIPGLRSLVMGFIGRPKNAGLRSLSMAH